MKKLAILTSRATSLSNVAKDIATVARELGLIPNIYDTPQPSFLIRSKYDGCIVIMTFSPLLTRVWFLRAYELRFSEKVPTILYTTVEGRPRRDLIPRWYFRLDNIVANSNFTKEMIESVGFNVLDVVYHGIDLNMTERSKEYIPYIKKKLVESTKADFIVGTVAMNHPRKGLDMLKNVASKVLQKNKNIKFYLITSSFIESVPNLVVDTTFGSLPRLEILARIGSFTYLLIPSLAEGFGLPLIEANAMGVPVIHPDYAPLSEITCSGNLRVKVKNVFYNDTGDGIEYEYHIYDTNEMADKIIEAYDIYKNYKSQYEDMKAKVVENAKRFDIRKLYPKLIKLLEENF